MPLNNFEEHSGSILTRLRENLQKITVVVEIDQNLQFLQLKKNN